MLLLGLAGIAMGIAVLVYSLWPGGLGRPVTPLWRLITFGGSGLILVSGVSLVHQYFRRKRRCSRARTLIPGELLPPEAYDLGPPFALHQRGSLTRWTLIGMGVILLMMAAACAAMFIRGEAREGRVLELACLGLPGGIFTIWKGCTSRGLRILVCPEGFVLCRGYRGEVWRWDQIEAVFLKPDKSTQPVIGHVYTLRREDGERFTFSADTEYVENQLGIRAQYETSRRMLPRLRATLAAGGMVDFGPLQLSTAGMHKDQQMVPWSAITGVTVEEGQLRIRKQDQTWAIGIERLANVGVFWTLATQLRWAAAVAHCDQPGY
jgi:hypothetical protein